MAGPRERTTAKAGRGGRVAGAAQQVDERTRRSARNLRVLQSTNCLHVQRTPSVQTFQSTNCLRVHRTHSVQTLDPYRQPNLVLTTKFIGNSINIYISK